MARTRSLGLSSAGKSSTGAAGSKKSPSGSGSGNVRGKGAGKRHCSKIDRKKRRVKAANKAAEASSAVADVAAVPVAAAAANSHGSGQVAVGFSSAAGSNGDSAGSHSSAASTSGQRLHQANDDEEDEFRHFGEDDEDDEDEDDENSSRFGHDYEDDEVDEVDDVEGIEFSSELDSSSAESFVVGSRQHVAVSSMHHGASSQSVFWSEPAGPSTSADSRSMHALPVASQRDELRNNHQNHHHHHHHNHHQHEEQRRCQGVVLHQGIRHQNLEEENEVAYATTPSSSGIPSLLSAASASANLGGGSSSGVSPDHGPSSSVVVMRLVPSTSSGLTGLAAVPPRPAAANDPGRGAGGVVDNLAELVAGRSAMEEAHLTLTRSRETGVQVGGGHGGPSSSEVGGLVLAAAGNVGAGEHPAGGAQLLDDQLFPVCNHSPAVPCQAVYDRSSGGGGGMVATTTTSLASSSASPSTPSLSIVAQSGQQLYPVEPQQALVAVAPTFPAAAPQPPPPQPSFYADALLLYEDMKQRLECPVCCKISLPPVMQCRNGHVTCNNCRLKVRSCPLCREVDIDIRNLFAEKAVAFVTIPCEFNLYGCKVETPYRDRETHQKGCKFRPYNCPYIECDSKLSPSEVVSHVSTAHRDDCRNSDGPEITASMILIGNFFGGDGAWSPRVITCYDRTFFDVALTRDRWLHHWVWLLGEEEEAKGFVYEITAFKGSTKYMYAGEVSSLRVADDEIVTTGQCLSISDPIGKRLRDGDKIRYKLKLTRKSRVDSR